MKISIITVSYNSEKTIARTIESVLNQTYTNMEYIIVDGSSKDSTIEIIESYCERFAEKDIEYRYISEPDRGMYDAMNKGIAMATGDIIGILNSDDWYEPKAIESVVNAANADMADIYMGHIRIYNGNQIIIKHAKNRKYRTSRDFNHPAMFVRRECYQDVGKYGIDNVHDDYGWFLKACKMYKIIIIIDGVLTNYPTGGVGSKKSFVNTIKRIGTKYKVYIDNGYSKIYFLECAVHEIVKFVLVKG